MSAIEPTVAMTSRGELRLPARLQTVAFTVAMAPVASAVARAFDRPGTSRHGWLARTMPRRSLR